MGNGWHWFWRVIGVLALISSFACAFFLYALWKATDLRPVAAGRAVELDSISLQLDILALTLTAVGTALGAIGLFGYQNIKDVAIARAEQVAADEARRTTQVYSRVDKGSSEAYLNEVGVFVPVDELADGASSVLRANRFDPATVPVANAVKEEQSHDARDGGHEGDRASSGARAAGPDGPAG